MEGKKNLQCNMRYTADDRLSESVSQTGYTYTYASVIE